MKLSKVKKVCLDGGYIIVKKVDKGIDISTWIGTQSALYPVRGMTMNAALAVRIWEIEGKKLNEMQILEDTEDDEALTLISQEDLKGIDFLIDPITPVNANEHPGLKKIATIDGYILLTDRDTEKSWVFREDKLAPVEGNNLIYIPVKSDRYQIAVYGDGELQAVIYAGKWNTYDLLGNTIGLIAKVCQKADRGQQR